MYYNFLISSSIFGLLGCFHSLVVVLSVAMKIVIQTSFWINVFIFWGQMPRNGIVWSYGRSVLVFWLDLHIVFRKN